MPTTLAPPPMLTTVPASKQFRITKPVCPTCGATLHVRILALAPAKKDYIADQIDVQCEGTTPAGITEAERWADRHAVNVDKMRAVRNSLLTWINSRYRFTPTT